MKIHYTLLACMFCVQFAAKAQMKIGTNPTTINGASLLELESNNKGLVFPRVALSDVSSSSPLPSGLLTGTVVYNINAAITNGNGTGLYLWNGTLWMSLNMGATSATAWSLSGNLGTNSGVNFLGTTDNISLRFRTNNIERMMIDSTGKIGIGTRSAPNALSVIATNPLYLSGVQATSAFNSDSILTINAGVVKKTPSSTISGSYWSITGNTGINSGINFLGTTNNISLRFRTNNIERMVIDSTGKVGIGTRSAPNALSVIATNPLYLSGVQATSALSSDSVLTIYNGVVKKTPYSALTSPTTNTLTLSTNTLTSTVNGVAATSSAVSGVSNASSANTLSTTVNGVTGAAVPIINSNENTLTQSGGLVTAVNGVADTTSILSGTINNVLGYNASGTPVYQSPSSILGGATTHTIDLSGNVLTSTVNGVADTSKSVSSVGNISSANTLSTTVNGVTGTTVPIINSNGNALTQAGGLVTTVNGVSATTSIPTGTVNNILGYNASGTPVYQPLSNINLSTAWNITGNSGTNYATNFLGTTDNVSMRFRTNNIQRMILDSLGSLAIGSEDFDAANRERFLVDYGNTVSHTIATFKGSINDYLQMNIQNRNAGRNASTDYVATANDGTEDTLYVDMGINSSTYAPSVENWGGPHDAYLYSNSRNLVIGTQATTSDVIFLLGGGRIRNNAIMRLNAADNNVVIGKGEATTGPTGTTLRAPNAQTGSTNVAGGILTLSGGSATGTAGGGGVNITGGVSSGSGTGGSVNIYGASSSTGSYGAVSINSSINSATNINTGTSNSNVTIGGNANNILLPKFSTVGGLYYTSLASGQISTTGSDMVWDSINDRLGIGTTNPGYKLSVLSSGNPLYLSGVQTTSTFSSDSILTINSGVVKKAPYSSITNSTTNTLMLNTNTLTSTVNGVVATSNAVSGVGNISSANTLSTTVNGVTGITVPIINSNGNALTQAGGLVTTVNGVSATTSIPTGTVNNILGYNASGTPVYQPLSNINLSTAWNVTGNSGTSYTTNFLGTTDNASMRFRTNNIQRMIIDSIGRIGIGLNNPSYALSVLSASNPLYLSGLQATSTLSSDSILTVAGGVVKKAPYSSLNNDYWGLTGNSGTNPNTNFLGTTNNVGLHIRTNNQERMFIDSLGDVAIGTNLFDVTNPEKFVVDYGNTASHTIGVFKGSINDYLQINIQNRSAGSNASTDYVATANDGTEDSLYVDMGINSSTYAPSVDNWGGPHDAYLYSNSRNLVIGTQATASDVIFLVGGGRIRNNAIMRLNAADNHVVLGKGEGTLGPTGTTLRGPNAQTGSTNIAGGSLTVAGGSATGTAGGGGVNITGGISSGSGTGGSVNIYGASSSTGSYGAVSINSSINSATNINTGTSNSNVTIGGNANNILLPKFSTVGGLYYTSLASGQISTTGSDMVWDSINDRLGIGTTNPGYKLSVLSSGNPLYLSGVQTTSTFSSDSILTINGGVVKKAPYSSLPSGSSNGWSLTGNSGTNAAINFLGTTDAQPLVIKSLNRQLAYFDGNLYSIALGYGAVNGSSDHNVAIGYNATTNNQYTLAAGYNATATGVRSVAIGNGAAATIASGAEAVAIGYNAISSNVQATAMGYQATASGAYGVALGYGSTASASQSTAIGYSSLASAQYSNAIGFQAQATGLQSTAIGYKAQTGQSNTILLGDVSTPNLYVGIGTAAPTAKLHIVGGTTTNYPLQMTGLPTGVAGTDNILTINSSGVVGYITQSVINNTYWTLSGNAAPSGSYLGTTNTTPLQFKFNSTSAGYLDANNTSFGTSSAATSGTSNTAIGYSATASNSATAIGANAAANQAGNTAIGNSAVANVTSQATAIGASSQALYQYNVAVGYNAQATISSQETVIGSSAQAQGQNNIAVGYSAKANGSDKITVVGSSAQASFQNNTVIGYGAIATTNSQATAVGASAQAGAQNATSLGYTATATGTQSTAIGTAASATAQNATAIGNGASATVANTLILGSGANVGIGTSSPTNKLSVLATNPLYLSGVQATSTLNADSVLTINAGVVKKAAYTSLSPGWSLTGNSGTSASANFIGTTDAVDFVARTNNTERMRITSAGDVIIGSGESTNSPTDGLIRGASATGGNKTGADLTIQAGNGTGNGGSGNIIFQTATAGSANGNGADIMSEKLRINDAGNVGIATTAPTEKLDVTGNLKFSGALMPNNLPGTSGNILRSGGAGTAPTWSDLNTLAWALGGNSVTAVKTLGTTSNYDLPFITNNTEVMRLTTGGNLGIGITAPENQLHIVDYTSQSATPDNMVTIETRNTAANSASQPAQWSNVRQVSTPQYIANQNVVSGVINFGYRAPSASTYNNAVQIQCGTMNSNAIIGFATRTGMTNGNPAGGTMTGGITVSTGITYNMVLNGTVLGVANLLGGATGLTCDANGNIIRNPSDARLKTNVTTIAGALDKVEQLRGVTYNWIDTKRFGTEKEIGFIAQEIEKVVPEVVKSGGEYKSVNYGAVTALLAEAMKEQQKQIEAQTQKSQSLQQQLDAQQKTIELLMQQVKELKEKVK